MRSIALVALALASVLAAPAVADEVAVREWAFVYVMSYDNNLERCGPIILDGLKKGTADTDVAVTVLADFTDEEGLIRYTLQGGAGSGVRLETENSASEEVLAEYLDWALETVPARHYALVFLDHGGDLDDMCIDENPGVEGAKNWLSAKLVGPVIRDWRKNVEANPKAKGKVDLLFLQQCGRGSIDNLYNFRESAAFIMASQTTVGAPNTYYAATVNWISGHLEATGLELARQIMESDEHYTNYVCVDGAELAGVPKKLDPVIQELLAAGDLSLPEDPALCFGGQGRGAETNYDLLDWLGGLYSASAVPESKQASWKRFRTWVEDDLIQAHTRRPEQARRTAKWTGLALFVPAARRVRTKYEDYPLYQDSRLDELWARLYPPG